MLISMGRSSNSTIIREMIFLMGLSHLLGEDPFGVCMVNVGYGHSYHCIHMHASPYLGT